MGKPSADQMRDAWDAAVEAERRANEAWAASDQLMYDAYGAGWRVADIAEAVGLGAGRITERRLYRRLRKVFDADPRNAETG